MKKIRLYVEQILSPGTSVILSEQQSHYIRNVMRLCKYDKVFLFNGKDGEWLGEITTSRVVVEIKLKECIREQQKKTNLYLYCAIVKNNALNNVVRQATEMGVTSIQFILTEHTAIRNVNLARVKLQVIEAAEQCERMNIPGVLPTIHFKELLNLDKDFILCDKTGNRRLPSLVFENKKDIAIIIGPEGGFSSKELDLADKFCQKLSFGNRILRVDTAVVVALAYCVSQWGY